MQLTRRISRNSRNVYKFCKYFANKNCTVTSTLHDNEPHQIDIYQLISTVGNVDIHNDNSLSRSDQLGQLNYTDDPNTPNMRQHGCYVHPATVYSEELTTGM